MLLTLFIVSGLFNVIMFIALYEQEKDLQMYRSAKYKRVAGEPEEARRN